MSLRLTGRDDPECVRDILRERSEGVKRSVSEDGKNSSKSSSAGRSADKLTSMPGVGTEPTSVFQAGLCVCPREDGTPAVGPSRFLDSVSKDV